MSSYRKFIKKLSNILKLDGGLLEKDYLMHNILIELTKRGFWKEFLFKSGTCLLSYKGSIRHRNIDIPVDFLLSFDSSIDCLAWSNIMEKDYSIVPINFIYYPILSDFLSPETR